jgi:uncharacterized protein YegP (UPF0339 family)
MTGVEFYTDRAGFWRWRVTAANGQIVAASSEGFASKQKAQENYRLVRASGDEASK